MGNGVNCEISSSLNFQMSHQQFVDKLRIINNLPTIQSGILAAQLYLRI